MVKFSEDLWDSFEVVNSKAGQGIQVVADIADFLKKRAQIESEYAKNLAALCKAAPGSGGGGLFGKSGPPAVLKETTTLKAALLSIQEEGSRAATGHQDFANKLLTDIVKPLETLLKAKDAEHKKVVMDGQKRLKALHDAKQAAEKGKDTYLKASKEAELATEAHEKSKKDLAADTNNKKHQEAEKRAGQKAGPLNDKAKASEAQYQKAVEASNELTTKTFGEYIPPLIDSLQSIEEERYNQLKTAVQEYVTAQKAVPTNLEERVNDIDKLVSAIDIDADLSEFVEAHKTKATEPEKLKFVPFKEPAAGSEAAPEAAAPQKEKEPESKPAPVVLAEEPEPVHTTPAVEEQKPAKSEEDLF